MNTLKLLLVPLFFVPFNIIAQSIDVYVHDANEEWFMNDEILSIKDNVVKSIQIDEEDILVCTEKLGSANKECFILLNLEKEFGKKQNINLINVEEKGSEYEILLYEINKDVLSLYIVIYDDVTERIRRKEKIKDYEVLGAKRWPEEHYISTIDSPDKNSKLIVITSRKLKGFRSNYFFSSYLELVDTSYNIINTSINEDFYAPSFALNNEGEINITRLKNWDHTFTVEKILKDGNIENRNLEEFNGPGGIHSLNVIEDTLYGAFYDFNKKDNYFVVVEITENNLDTLRHYVPRELDKLRRNNNYFSQLYSVETDRTIYFSNSITETASSHGLTLTIINGYALWGFKNGELKLLDFDKYTPPFKKSRISYLFEINDSLMQLLYLKDTEGKTMLFDNLGVSLYNGFEKIEPTLNFITQDISKTSLVSIESVHITKTKDLVIMKVRMLKGEKKWILLDVGVE